MIVSDQLHFQQISVTVNGEPLTRSVPTHRRLLDFLRDDLNLTAAKESCGEGECGACTVLLDGKPVNSCLILAVEADGAEVVTVEGIDRSGEARDLFESFLEHHAVQCGFCIPGIIVSSHAHLKQHPDADEPSIRYALAGNICRCTGYTKILEAVQAAGGMG